MEKKSDDLLRIEVENEIAWDTQTCNLGLKVDVSRGVAKIIGVVPNYATKEAAQRAAHRVAGVLDVANEIVIKPPRVHDDEEIAHAVRRALEWGAAVPDEKIKSTVSNGWVTLEGDIDFLWQKEDVEKAVQAIASVLGVTNKLAVVGAEKAKIDTEKLHSAIEKALERRAEREAERLSVQAEDGEVSLNGRVHSWNERRAVIGAVSHAPGVKRINDNLQIDPYF